MQILGEYDVTEGLLLMYTVLAVPIAATAHSRGIAICDGWITGKQRHPGLLPGLNTIATTLAVLHGQ